MNKTAKIIVWAIIAVVLTGILVWGIVGGSTFGNAWSNFANNLSNIRMGDFVDKLPDDAQTGTSFEKDSAQLKEISMIFVDEDVHIVPTDGDTVRVEEMSSHAISKEDLMRYGVKGGELVVQSGRSGRVFGWVSSYGIEVNVMIPRSFEGTLSVSTVSGTIDADGMNAGNASLSTTSGDVRVTGGSHGELRADTVSGNVEIVDTIAGRLRADTMSGDVKAQGWFTQSNIDSTSGTIDIATDRAEKIETDTTSGEITIECANTDQLEKISADSVSGSVKISLPEGRGFKLSYDTVSGSENNDFAMKNHEYANGEIKIDVNTTSGSLYMEAL